MKLKEYTDFYAWGIKNTTWTIKIITKRMIAKRWSATAHNFCLLSLDSFETPFLVSWMTLTSLIKEVSSESFESISNPGFLDEMCSLSA